MSDIAEQTTILVVEDQTLVPMHGIDILEDAGFRVLEAGDADEAIAILAQPQDVSLLFTDVDMPGSMDGLELARLVHDRWPNIRLLLTSGHHHLQECAIPDDGKFVRKPWRQDMLIAKIREILSA